MLLEHILIVGLGNPGKHYENTRHNVGFMVVDAIANHFYFPQFCSKFSSLVSSKTLFEYKITLAKPQNFMNLSGTAVAKLVYFYKLPLNNLIVIHDDLDLSLARPKIKIGGGAAGHNGLRSIDQQIGNNYYRLRLGIGRPQRQNISDFVLEEFNEAEKQAFETLIDTLIQNFEFFLKTRKW